ncbi:multidrug resistance-associated protein 4 isoform X1, partial [Tachysurus ichikawai]
DSSPPANPVDLAQLKAFVTHQVEQLAAYRLQHYRTPTRASFVSARSGSMLDSFWVRTQTTVRLKEISKIMSSSYLRGLNMASFFAASKIIEFVTFTVYVLVGNTITASRVFMALSLYSAVRLTVTLFFPTAIEKVSEASISIRRIKVQFLMNLGDRLLILI